MIVLLYFFAKLFVFFKKKLYLCRRILKQTIMNNKIGKPLFILSERAHLGEHKIVFACHSEVNMNSKIKKIYGLNDDDINALKKYGHFDFFDYTIEIEKVYMNLVYPAISDESKIYADKKITESNY